MAQGAREHIVVGIGEGPSDETALDWVAARASHRPVSVTVVMSADLLFADYEVICADLEAAERVVTDRSPATPTRGLFVDGSVAATLLRAAQDADLLVLGADPGSAADGAATPLRLATQAPCVTVLVPSSWSEATGPVVVGVDADDSAEAALVFAEREAAATDSELRTVRPDAVTDPVPVPVPVLAGVDALATETEVESRPVPAAEGPIDVEEVLGGLGDAGSAQPGAARGGADAADAPIPVDRVMEPALVVVGAGHRALVTGTLPSPEGDELLTDRIPLAIVR